MVLSLNVEKSSFVDERIDGLIERSGIWSEEEEHSIQLQPSSDALPVVLLLLGYSERKKSAAAL
jgi:hypothetical protein